MKYEIIIRKQELNNGLVNFYPIIKASRKKIWIFNDIKYFVKDTEGDIKEVRFLEEKDISDLTKPCYTHEMALEYGKNLLSRVINWQRREHAYCVKLEADYTYEYDDNSGQIKLK